MFPLPKSPSLFLFLRPLPRSLHWNTQTPSGCPRMKDLTPVTPTSCPSESKTAHNKTSSAHLPHSLWTPTATYSIHTVTFIKAFITQFAWLRINTQQGGLLSLNTQHTDTHTQATRCPKKARAWADSRVQHHTTKYFNTSWSLSKTCRYVHYMSREQQCCVRNLSGDYEANKVILSCNNVNNYQ